MSIYITGDCHRSFERFSTDNFPEQKEMTKDDYVIILGDFGYWDNTAHNEWWMNWLNNKPFTTLFVDGNHENFDMLKALPTENWNGGKVQKIKDSVIHLMRGEVYNLQGSTFWCFGGAQSHDIQDGILEPNAPDFKLKKAELDKRGAMYRINHLSWWAEEMPNRMEMEFGLSTLEDYGHKVDYILTHDAPFKAMYLVYPGYIELNRLNKYLDYVDDITEYKRWFFGHHHENRNIDDRFTLLYEQIIKLN